MRILGYRIVVYKCPGVWRLEGPSDPTRKWDCIIRPICWATLFTIGMSLYFLLR